jgi:hypothetical protein
VSAQILLLGLTLKSSAKLRRNAMQKIKPPIELALLLGIAAYASGQTTPTVHQTATRSTCANIVALSGAKVDCSHLTPAQQKALDTIPSILKTALENQDYLDAIMRKLEEMSVVQPPSQTVNAPNGIGAIGGTLINPQVNNFGYMQKTLSQDWMIYISGLMKPLADTSDRGDLITCQMGNTNSCDLAVQLVKIFRDAGWNLPGSGYSQSVMMTAPAPLLIMVQSAKATPTGAVDKSSLPPGVEQLATALKNCGVDVQISIDEKVPINKFKILIGDHP